MTDQRDCSCGAASSHDLVASAPTCCWCHVVEHGRDPFKGHPDCLVAAKRLAPLQARFRTAVLAERECCAQLVEQAKAPLAVMPKHLSNAMRRSPNYVMGAVVETLTQNLAAVIRARI